MPFVTSKAAFLKAERSERYGTNEEYDDQLVKDISYTLQGVSSTYIAFVQDRVTFPSVLPVSLISLLKELIEPGLLYRKVHAYTMESNQGGLVGQSFRAAIGDELTKYLNLVAVIENEVRAQRTGTVQEQETGSGITKQSIVTLRRCIVWTRDAVLKLRLMSYMIEKTNELKGGQLINVIYALSSHGDPFVAKFANRLVTEISKPFYEMLAKWINEGELLDPNQEFLVYETEKMKSGSKSQHAWSGRYALVFDMVPRWISVGLAEKILLIGKSLNFIRHACLDTDFVEAHSRRTTRLLSYDDQGGILEGSIDSAYSTTAAHLIKLMSDKFCLFDHLKALKKYILLGQGDFVAALMESLGSSLERPATSLYRHNLTASLESAVRASNAQFEPGHVLRHLDARMLEGSRGTVGWEVFTLEYRIDAPINVVISEYNAKQYLKIFNFLWRLKRVEFALSSAWRRSITLERTVLKYVPNIHAQWHVSRGVIAEMIHFVTQLQYYILFEVIESSWHQLELALHKKDTTLDALIKAHSDYMNNITHKGLLGMQSQMKDGENPSPLVALGEILKICLAYKEQMDQLYAFTNSQFMLQQSCFPSRRIKFSGSNNPGEAPGPMSLASAELLTGLNTRLAKLSGEFKEVVQYLLGTLAFQPDIEMRFLGIRLNYNEYYEVSIPRQRSSTGSRHASKSSKETFTDKPKDKSRASEQVEETGARASHESKTSRTHLP